MHMHAVCHMDITYCCTVNVYHHIVIVYRHIKVVTCVSSHSATLRPPYYRHAYKLYFKSSDVGLYVYCHLFIKPMCILYIEINLNGKCLQFSLNHKSFQVVVT